MPSCAATFNENSVPPWKRVDFRGVLGRRKFETAGPDRNAEC
jgi:hypothetical protein